MEIIPLKKESAYRQTKIMSYRFEQAMNILTHDKPDEIEILRLLDIATSVLELVLIRIKEYERQWHPERK